MMRKQLNKVTRLMAVQLNQNVNLIILHLPGHLTCWDASSKVPFISYAALQMMSKIVIDFAIVVEKQFMIGAIQQCQQCEGAINIFVFIKRA